MNRADFAGVVGVSKAAITKAVKAGRLDTFPDGDIQLDGNNTKAYLEAKNIVVDGGAQADSGEPAPDMPQDIGSDARLNRAVKVSKIKTEKLRQEKLQLELAKERGELISYAFVDSNIFGYLDALSDILLEAPDTLIDTLHQNWEGLGEEAREVNMNEISEFITSGIEDAKSKILAEMKHGGNKT